MDALVEIERMAAGFGGTFGLYARHLVSGEVIQFNADESFPTASCIKVPVLIEVWKQALEGRFSLDDPLELRVENITTGTGVLLDLAPGLKLSVRDVALLMIVVSDNVATNMLIDLVGLENVNRTLRAMGFVSTELRGKIDWSVLDQDSYMLGISTPREMGGIIARLAEGRVLTPAACREMIGILGHQQYTDMIGRYLPYSRYYRQRGMRQEALVASKSGGMPGVRNDIGLVTMDDASFVFAGMTKDCADLRYGEVNEASTLIARSARAVYDHFNIRQCGQCRKGHC